MSNSNEILNMSSCDANVNLIGGYVQVYAELEYYVEERRIMIDDEVAENERTNNPQASFEELSLSYKDANRSKRANKERAKHIDSVRNKKYACAYEPKPVAVSEERSSEVAADRDEVPKKSLGDIAKTIEHMIRISLGNDNYTDYIVAPTKPDDRETQYAILITASAFVTPGDVKQYRDNVGACNKMLKKICRVNGWKRAHFNVINDSATPGDICRMTFAIANRVSTNNV